MGPPYIVFDKRNLLKKNFECIKHAHKAGYKGKSEISIAKESKKSPIEGDEVSPHAQDQSNKEPKKI